MAKRFLRQLVAFFWPPAIGKTLAYMLQSTEYVPRDFLRWFWRVNDFSRVMHRRDLVATRAAHALQMLVTAGIAGQIVLGFAVLYVGLENDEVGLPWFGLALMASAPVVWAHLVALVVGLGRVLVARPRERRAAYETAQLLHKHSGLRIAIAGSYGKTTMKEILDTVLGIGKKVAATPGNMNVVSSHVRFARNLSGDEDVLLIEFGEGKPGDVERFTRMSAPEYAVITGVAPAHLDTYGTLHEAGRDIFSVADAVDHDKLFVNAGSPEVRPFLKKNMQVFDQHGALGWKVQHAATSLDGTSFELVKAGRRLKLHSGLVGLHQVGPLAFAAALSLSLGLSEKQVVSGIAQTTPFEHRMQPYQLAGAWIIDDTYNGNIEGIRAGTELLKSLKARRKLYVTPGLVNQGKESVSIHQQVGQLVAAAKPDLVVLMQNSVTQHIQAGLIDAGYTGKIILENDPLDFYQNLSSFVAAGDVVLMQNDWTDNYH